MYLPNAGYEISRTYRYSTSIKVEACVIATKPWKKGSQMRTCSGKVCALTAEEEVEMESRDFSLIYSTKYDTTSLFLGPARFANHDCQPNVKFIPSDNGQLWFYVIKDIAVGDEVLVHYGNDYFGTNNEECLCGSCERFQIGGFKVIPDDIASRKSTCRVKNFNYYSEKFNDFILKPVKKVAIPKDCCYICSEKLLADQIDSPDLLIPNYMFKIRGSGKSNSKQSCLRCFRHYKIFSSIWPDRSYFVSNQRLENKEGAFESFAVVPGDFISDISKPLVVWVNPQDKGMWWPGIIIPKHLCILNHSLEKLNASANPEHAIVLFVETPPSIGTFSKDQIKIFDVEKEPFTFFNKADPSLLKRQQVVTAINVFKGQLPIGIEWSEFTNLFLELSKEYPNFKYTSDGPKFTDSFNNGDDVYENIPGTKPNVANPSIVWVMPKSMEASVDPGIWWPAIIIPREHCTKKVCSSLFNKLQLSPQTDAFVVYFEGPSSGIIDRNQMRSFQKGYEFFIKKDPSIALLPHVVDAINLSNGVFPSQGRWKFFLPTFKLLIEKFPSFFKPKERIIRVAGEFGKTKKTNLQKEDNSIANETESIESDEEGDDRSDIMIDQFDCSDDEAYEDVPQTNKSAETRISLPITISEKSGASKSRAAKPRASLSISMSNATDTFSLKTPRKAPNKCYRCREIGKIDCDRTLPECGRCEKTRNDGNKVRRYPGMPCCYDLEFNPDIDPWPSPHGKTTVKKTKNDVTPPTVVEGNGDAESNIVCDLDTESFTNPHHETAAVVVEDTNSVQMDDDLTGDFEMDVEVANETDIDGSVHADDGGETDDESRVVEVKRRHTISSFESSRNVLSGNVFLKSKRLSDVGSPIAKRMKILEIIHTPILSQIVVNSSVVVLNSSVVESGMKENEVNNNDGVNYNETSLVYKTVL